jgi:hypothetical protein
VELSEYVLEALRRDEEFVLYRGKPSHRSCSPSVLLLAPASIGQRWRTVTTRIVLYLTASNATEHLKTFCRPEDRPV